MATLLTSVPTPFGSERCTSCSSGGSAEVPLCEELTEGRRGSGRRAIGFKNLESAIYDLARAWRTVRVHFSRLSRPGRRREPLRLLQYANRKHWALNSAVECHLHTVEVIGSNPIAPTNSHFCFQRILERKGSTGERPLAPISISQTTERRSPTLLLSRGIEPIERHAMDLLGAKQR